MNGGGPILGVFVARSNTLQQNGIAGLAPVPIGTPGAVTTVGIGAGISATAGAGGNLSVTNYSNPLQVGQLDPIPGNQPITSLVDILGYTARQACKTLGG